MKYEGGGLGSVEYLRSVFYNNSMTFDWNFCDSECGEIESIVIAESCQDRLWLHYDRSETS